MQTSAPVLELRHIRKAFSGVVALQDATLALEAGTVHALVGENGAGKSTLIKVLAGVHEPDAGQILVDGVLVHFGNPAQARDAGVAVIYQEPTLFPDLSVAENIYMGRHPVDSRSRRVRWGALHEAVTTSGVVTLLPAACHPATSPSTTSPKAPTATSGLPKSSTIASAR